MKLTQRQLEAHLWGVANILRGKTAAQDYKNYILSLMCTNGSATSGNEEKLEEKLPVPFSPFSPSERTHNLAKRNY